MKWTKKKIAVRYTILFDGVDEVSAWIDKKKGFIFRKSYSSFSSAKRAYNNINSVKAIKRFAGKHWRTD